MPLLLHLFGVFLKLIFREGAEGKGSWEKGGERGREGEGRGREGEGEGEGGSIYIA